MVDQKFSQFFVVILSSLVNCFISEMIVLGIQLGRVLDEKFSHIFVPKKGSLVKGRTSTEVLGIYFCLANLMAARRFLFCRSRESISNARIVNFSQFSKL